MGPVPSPELLALKTQLDEWRQSHRKRARIPEHFYKTAVSLLDRHSVSLICRETRLRVASLRKHAAPPRAAKASSPSRRQRTFLQLEPADLTAPLLTIARPSENARPPCRLLFERADGSRLTLSLTTADWTKIEALCSTFLREP